MAYYYGDDPSSQYNQSGANSIQARQGKSKKDYLRQALMQDPSSGTQEQPERIAFETPEAPRTPQGTQRQIQPMVAALTGRTRQRTSQPNPDPTTDVGGQDLFNTANSGASVGTNPTTPTQPGNALGDVDRSQWNTEGWATPEYLGQAAGGAMAGWDQTNWDDQNMQTPKYVVGRILSNYSPDIQGLSAAMAEIQKAYPGATFDGKDKVTIPGLGTIDMLVNAGGENGSWAWQDLTNDPGTPGGGVNNALQTALLSGTGELMNPAQGILEGFDPSLLQDPRWREMLKSLGVNI